MTLADLKSHLDAHLNDLRRLQYLLDQSSFDDLYKIKETEIHPLVKDIGTSADGKIREGSLYKLKELLKLHEQAEETMWELRQMAQKLGVAKYTRMDKPELMSAIIIARKKQNDDLKDLRNSNRDTGCVNGVQAESGKDCISTSDIAKSNSGRTA